MSKAAKAVTTAAKTAGSAALSSQSDPLIKTMIPAGMASPAPPLGPILGQKGVNVASFCKHFNNKTAHIHQGVPMPTFITVNPDRTYQLEILTPHIPWMIMRCAGIRLGSHDSRNEVFGKITLKHVYEIAKVKLEDPFYWCYDEKQMCEEITKTARTCGVEVVREYDPAEYRSFLEGHSTRLRDRMRELEELKAAKVLRAATV